MKTHLKCTKLVFEGSQQRLCYRLYRNSYQASGRRLLLLHGAGVAGEDTWGYLVPHLEHWSEILVPDIRGMGETQFFDGVERPTSVEEALADIIELVDELQWWAFDMAGYSYGGLLALLLKQQFPLRIHKQFLLEPVLLDHESEKEIRSIGERYTEIAVQLRENADDPQGIMMFLDAIAPNRVASPKTEQMIVDRLSQRVVGFSYALDAVSDAIRRLNRQQLVKAQEYVSSFIGSRSVDNLHAYHQQLSRHRDDWFYHRVPGCDHSLPYQKPRQIARQMNADFELYMQRKPRID